MLSPQSRARQLAWDADRAVLPAHPARRRGWRGAHCVIHEPCGRGPAAGGPPAVTGCAGPACSSQIKRPSRRHKARTAAGMLGTCAGTRAEPVLPGHTLADYKPHWVGSPVPLWAEGAAPSQVGDTLLGEPHGAGKAGHSLVPWSSLKTEPQGLCPWDPEASQHRPSCCGSNPSSSQPQT